MTINNTQQKNDKDECIAYKENSPMIDNDHSFQVANENKAELFKPVHEGTFFLPLKQKSKLLKSVSLSNMVLFVCTGQRKLIK